ncbi:MAG TPA: hypothetical protein VKR52_17940 [Terracidiphilus sp.]|nr:hypothetical protein [Terracidiphilus sp.]
MRLSDSGFAWVHRELVTCASWLAPAPQRKEWKKEWLSELWHVVQARIPAGYGSWKAQEEITRFCLGAFHDALCLRTMSWRDQKPFARWSGSPQQCLLLLCAALAIAYGISLLLPGVRAESRPSNFQVKPGLVLIQDARSRDDSVATIPIRQFLGWRERRQEYFDGLAFYRIAEEAASTSTGDRTTLNVAHASSNLFALLGLAVRYEEPGVKAGASERAVILSDRIWKTQFGENPHIAGSVIELGGRTARVAGIVPFGSWRLPGKIDLWLLEPDSEIPSGGPGYVLAHLSRRGQSEVWSRRIHITEYTGDYAADDLWGVSIDERTRGPWDIFLFTMLLALLCLPAVASVSMSESSFSSHRPTWSKRIRQWAFLCVKISLLFPIAYFSSLDLAYWHMPLYSAASQYMQLISSFTICLFGMRWVMLDQRQRCPVCLKRVTHPASVGLASRTFLAWNGTEMICTDGHTMLHVPALPTSWFSTQRWLYLDTSWKFLFVAQGIEGGA